MLARQFALSVRWPGPAPAESFKPRPRRPAWMYSAYRPAKHMRILNATFRALDRSSKPLSWDFGLTEHCAKNIGGLPPASWWQKSATSTLRRRSERELAHAPRRPPTERTAPPHFQAP